MNYQKRVTKKFLCGILSVLLINTTHAQVLNRIVAIVDSGVVLESDIKSHMIDLKEQAKNRNVSFEETEKLRTQVLEQLIIEQIQVEIAKRKGMQIDDARVTEVLNQVAKNKKTDLFGLKQNIESNGKDFSEYRNKIRRQLLIQAVRDREVRSRIRISDAELDRFLETTEGQISTAPELLLSQIVVGIPKKSNSKALKAAEQKVLKIRSALLSGAPFSQLAARYSDAPEANQGGNLGWRNVLELNDVFSEALTDAKKNTLIGPIRSPVGFHLIAIRDRRGDEAVVVTEYRTRHILIKPDAVISSEKAKGIALNIRREIISGTEFAELAKRFSEDPLSAAKGGDLGWIRPDQVVPGFATVMTSLPVNTLSDVSQSRFGFHLIEVLDIREADVSEEQIKNKARRILTERKFSQELNSWLRQIRADAFVDIKL